MMQNRNQHRPTSADYHPSCRSMASHPSKNHHQKSLFQHPAKGALVGCAALLRHPDGSGELKSMFIRPAARGLGLSKMLLQAVETKARELKLSRIDLETGPKSHAALQLYEGAGYRLCGPFASYKHDPNSVFMTKDIAA